MAPQTRSQTRHSTPETIDGPTEYATPKKSEFFSAYDHNTTMQPMTDICAKTDISRETGYRWLRERRRIGSAACRKSRQRSQILGRKCRVNKSICKYLASKRNPVRDQLYEAQIEKHHLNVSTRTLQRSLKRNTKNAQRYKMAYTKKKISPANKQKRVDFAAEHKHKTVEDFWHLIFFTDEAHIDPAACKTGHKLREQGRRHAPENIQQKPKKEGNKLHWAGWVNWHAKCEKLEFYHDEEERTERPKRPRKPRHKKKESKEEWQVRLKEWEATAPHDVEVKPKSNSMTQLYYVERLLPVYISAIHNAQEREDLDWMLMEDNDQSHGHKGPKPGTDSLATTTGKEAGIHLHEHPPQSPDLNPIEGCWCILKERIKKRHWDTLDQLKEALQDEWSKITMEEVRERIAEMPLRCKTIDKSGGIPFKGDKW